VYPNTILPLHKEFKGFQHEGQEACITNKFKKEKEEKG
jgi:hypothetical protein